jgi:hypothetical protein
MWLAITLSACHSDRTFALAQLPLRPGEVVAVFPPDGAMHLSGDVPVEVVLGEASAGQRPTVTWMQDGVVRPLPCTLAWSGTVAHCGVLPAHASGDVGLVLSVTSGDRVMAVVPVARLPQAGLGWSLLEGTTVTALGGGFAASALVNSYLSEGSAFLALDQYDGEPGRYQLVAGPSGPLDAGGLGILAPGLGFVLPVEVGPEGGVSGSAPTAWLPLEVNGIVVRVLLLNVVVSARIEGDALADLALAAVLPALSLETLSGALGTAGPAMLSLVTLDVDRDGDGDDDAATVRIEGSQRPRALAGWQ